MFVRKRSWQRAALVALALVMLAGCGGGVANKDAYPNLTDDEAQFVSDANKVLESGKVAFYEVLNIAKGLRAEGKINDYQKGKIGAAAQDYKTALAIGYAALKDYLEAKARGEEPLQSTVAQALQILARDQQYIIDMVTLFGGKIQEAK
jgi:hypothetical protein